MRGKNEEWWDEVVLIELSPVPRSLPLILSSAWQYHSAFSKRITISLLNKPGDAQNSSGCLIYRGFMINGTRQQPGRKKKYLKKKKLKCRELTFGMELGCAGNTRALSARGAPAALPKPQPRSLIDMQLFTCAVNSNYVYRCLLNIYGKGTSAWLKYPYKGLDQARFLFLFFFFLPSPI